MCVFFFLFFVFFFWGGGVLFCFYLRLSFCSRSSSIRSLHDLPNLQLNNQSINIECLGIMGFATISLNSNVKILLACDNFLYNNLP